MKATSGKADGKAVNAILQERKGASAVDRCGGIRDLFHRS